MKTIGLLGGMSWESTVSYYQLINQGVKKRLGGLHSAKICLRSVDFQPLEILQHQNRWEELADILIAESLFVEKGGADCLVICTNTMHKLAEQIEPELQIPLLHIADATAEKLKADGKHKIGLLGTKFTMQQGFYKGRLVEKHGLDILVPQSSDQLQVHDIIYQQLCQGRIRGQDREEYLEIIDRLADRGAEAIILGCTEIGLLLSAKDCDLPLYDTTKIHADFAVNWALK